MKRNTAIRLHTEWGGIEEKPGNGFDCDGGTDMVCTEWREILIGIGRIHYHH